MKAILRLGVAWIAALCFVAAHAATVLQAGPTTPQHIPMYSGQGFQQPIIKDGGGAGGGALGVNPGEIGITSVDPKNVYPSVNSGNGELGTHECLYDAPTNNATGYHYFCLDPNAQGGGLIVYGASSLAVPLPLQFIINGVTTTLAGFNNATIYYFDTLAAFTGQSSLPSYLTYVYVRAMSGTYPPAAGRAAVGLWFKPVGIPTGLYGEVTVGGRTWDPVYSTSPVNAGEFGIVADGAYSQAGGTITATSNGTTTLTTTNTTGLSAANIGNFVATVDWHSRNAASLPIVPKNTTLVSYVANTSITLSSSVPAQTNMNLVFYSESMTGTDNAPMFQAALNFALQNNYAAVYVPDGIYRVNDSLQAGWGNTFTSLCLQSASRGQTSAAPGVSLLFPKTDRYAINFQGMRSSCMKGITIIGPNYNYALAGQAFNNALSSDARDWIAPDLDTTGVSSGGLNLNSPLAGVTVDARSGSSPAIPYPNLTFPSFTGIVSQYNADLSSDLDFEDLNIQGFAIDFASGLNTNQQGDFIKVDRALVGAAPYAIGIFNTQSRVPYINSLNANGDYTILTGAALGEQTGEWGGLISNLAGSDIYQLFDFPFLGYHGPQIFDGVYCENCVRLGNFGSSTNQGISFRGGNLNFNEGLHGQIPACYISGNNVQMIFDGTEIVGNQRIANWECGSATLDFRGGIWIAATDGATSTALTLADNYTGGISGGGARYSTLNINNLHGSDNLNAGYFTTGSGGTTAYRPTTDVFSSVTSGGKINKAPMQQFARTYVDSQSQSWQIEQPAAATIPMNVGGGFVGNAPSYSNDVMSFTYCTGIQSGSVGYGPSYILYPGSLLIAVDSGTIFVVTAISGPSANANCSSPSTAYSVTTQQQNNMTVTPGTNTFASNLNTTPLLPSGVFIDSNPVVTIPLQLEYGTVASNCAITAVNRGDTYGGDALTYYTVGSALWGLPYGNPINPWPLEGSNAGGTLSAINNSGTGTITPLQGSTCIAGTYPLFPFPIK